MILGAIPALDLDHAIGIARVAMERDVLEPRERAQARLIGGEPGGELGAAARLGVESDEGGDAHPRDDSR